jgi:glc operon protein GlcG
MSTITPPSTEPREIQTSQGTTRRQDSTRLPESARFPLRRQRSPLRGMWGMALALLTLIGGGLLGTTPVEAQPLTYEEARAAMDAAEAEARANNWNLAIIISDAEGVPLYVRRFGGAGVRFHEIASGKIRTVLATGMSTGEYAAALRDGRIEAIEGGITFEGGYLIRRNGEIIGAMSASGARGSEDAQVVRAGLAAIGLPVGG